MEDLNTETVETTEVSATEPVSTVETKEAPSPEPVKQEKPAEKAEKQDKKVITSLKDLKELSNKAKIEPETEQKPLKTDVKTPENDKKEPISTDTWKPFDKVKVYGKEVELPQEYKELITKDNEDKLRGLFAKALAVDEMSVKNKNYIEQYSALSNTHNTLNKAISRVEGYIKNEDFDSLLETLKIPEVSLQKWMLQKLEQKELPPEQQAVYNKKSEYQKQLYDKDQELEFYRSQYESVTKQQEQAQIQNNLSALDNVLSKPDIQSVVAEFDKRLGKPGAFKNEVIQRAAYMEEKLGRSLTIEEAVQDFKNLVAASAPTTAPQATKVVPPRAVQNPTIPSITGKATSPVAKKVTSLDDLKNIKKQIIASEVSRNN